MNRKRYISTLIRAIYPKLRCVVTLDGGNSPTSSRDAWTTWSRDKWKILYLHFHNVKEGVGTQWKEKINTKIPTRTKTVGMSKIVKGSDESRGFKIGRSNHRRCSVKTGVLENFSKLTEKHLCPSPIRVFYCQFYEIFENTFLQNTSERLLLMTRLDGKKF